MSVCGFSGVILIARPQALFGATSKSPLDGVTPGQRMISITSGPIVPVADDTFLILPSSAALIGVVAATGSCEFGLCRLCPLPYPRRSRRYATPCDWKTSTCAPRQHLLLCAMRIAFHNRVCSALSFVSLKGPVLTHLSMIIFNVHPVIPTRVLTLVIMFLVSLLGLAAQVCSTTFSSRLILICKLRRRF
jgi:hypothetical protein